MFFKRTLLLLGLLVAACHLVHGQDTIDDQLKQAAYDGDIARVRQLLDQGANINTESKTGPTPLYFATMQSHQEVALLLIERGAAVNRSWFDHGTPLMWAAAWDERAVIKALRRHGVRLSQRDDMGWTAYTFAVFHDHAEASRLLRPHSSKRPPA